ncbi:hypothetical protein ACOMHN_025906 [Nucella lapillus]
MPSARIPGNWKGFLRVSENKEELFNLLAQKIAGMNVHGKILLSTQSESVLSSPPLTDTSSLVPCSHEEADTRLILHVRETWEDCEKKVMDIIYNKMEIDDNIVIDRDHHVGTAIIVAFRFFKDKQRILS